jgi:peptide/nickel transport system permease protein
MNARDTLEGLGNFWREFIKVKSGLVGLVILVLFFGLAIFGPSIVPFPGAIDHWRDINFWQDNPQAAPPVWVNLFSAKKGVVSSYLDKPKITEEQTDNGVVVRRYAFTYLFSADEPPRDIVVRFEGAGQIPVNVTVTRPDGLEADIYSEQMDIAEGVLQRVSITNNCAQSMIEFIRAQNEDVASNLSADLIRPVRILFAKLDSSLLETPVIVKGTYTITMTAILLTPEFTVKDPSIIVSGHVSGILGTDLSKRDIFTGIVIGSRWALIIGILTSLITVIVGVVLGVIAA